MKLILMLLSVTVLSGCAAFRNPDGTFNEEKAKAAVAATATGAAFIPPPFGELIALVVAAGGAAVIGHLKGKEKGWDEKEKDMRKAAPPAPEV